MIRIVCLKCAWIAHKLRTTCAFVCSHWKVISCIDESRKDFIKERYRQFIVQASFLISFFTLEIRSNDPFQLMEQEVFSAASSEVKTELPAISIKQGVWSQTIIVHSLWPTWLVATSVKQGRLNKEIEASEKWNAIPKKRLSAKSVIIKLETWLPFEGSFILNISFEMEVKKCPYLLRSS